MNIIHITPSVGPGSFGLGPVALNLCREQIDLGKDSSIWCLDTESDIQWASSASVLSAGSIRSFPMTGPRILRLSLEMERTARRELLRDAIIHQHAIWTGVSRVTNMLRTDNGIPSVITPHGSLEKWALNQSWWKKQIVLALYEKNNLHHASCIHAVGENEIADCRDFGLSNPIAVIPNGISSEWLNSCGNGGAFRDQFGILAEKRVMLFLSRITPKKGLPMLLEVLHNLRKELTDWCVVIAGAGEFGHQAEIESIILDKGLNDLVKLVGPLFGKNKRDAFAAADLFVLPSYSEGAPIVILEALGAGVPVLATKASPWQNLETHDCGWWPNISSDSIYEALKDALSRSPEQLKLMGQRGKELVSTEYTWAKSAQMTIELYEWLLGRSQRPDFVVVD